VKRQKKESAPKKKNPEKTGKIPELIPRPVRTAKGGMTMNDRTVSDAAPDHTAAAVQKNDH
jgi:hypothetical protein